MGGLLLQVEFRHQFIGRLVMSMYCGKMADLIVMLFGMVFGSAQGAVC